MAVHSTLFEEAEPLVAFVKNAVNNTAGVGEQTTTIYDTAWVSMLRKQGDPERTLLFPECFQYVLEQQLPHGGWESYDVPIDGVVNSLGGLLCLKKNADIALPGVTRVDLQERIERATRYLCEQLENWDVSTADHVGFEIVIPALLKSLEQEGIQFEFPARGQLMALNRQKLARVPPSIWSKKIQTTLTHSLESFVGEVDFDKIGHLLVYGSMGSSPAATAAYLQHCSTWNEEAENYLRDLVMKKTKGGVFSGLPTMFPSTGFEVLWVASTLLEYGFDEGQLSGLGSIVDITKDFFDAQDGLASGFSNISVPDADDTAKSILVQNLVGVPTTPENLIARFEGDSHFLTYGMERHPSITTNCNVLSCILQSPGPMRWVSQIEKCARFLVAAWSRPDIPFTDKWNTSEYYPMMLVSEALIRLLKFCDDGVVHSLSSDLIEQEVPLVLFQILMQILQKQNPSGAWGHKPSREMTAYAIIALTNLGSLPFLGQLSTHVEAAIEKGRIYIKYSSEAPDTEYIWIAKTTYSPIKVSQAYILSALATKYPKYSLSQSLTDLLAIPQKGVAKYMRMYSSLPCLSDSPLWRIQGSIIEGFIHMNKLSQVRIDMFGRPKMKKDEYFGFIAMCFACANNLHGNFIKTSIIFEMMVLVLRVYQVDEYVEHVIGTECGLRAEESGQIVDRIFQRSHSGHSCKGTKKHAPTDSHLNGHANEHANGNYNGLADEHTNGNGNGVNGKANHAEIHQKLSAFVCSILCNPFVRAASERDRDILSYELRQCLLAHISQIDDSERFFSAQEAKRSTPRGSFHNWARTTASSHSCAPLSLAFLRCLSTDPRCQSNSAEQQYIVQDLWMHLSTKARMENDRASLRRDRNEKNLNSLDFPEFEFDHTGRSKNSDAQQKARLSAILNYERKCIDLGLNALKQVTAGKGADRDFNALCFYYFLTDIYSDIYKMKDISCER